MGQRVFSSCEESIHSSIEVKGAGEQYNHLIVSLVDGVAPVGHCGWDAFNDSTDLITQMVLLTDAFKRHKMTY